MTQELLKRTKRVTRYKGAEEESATKLVSLLPLNDRQGDYINAINTSDQVIGCGYSGTGKSYIAATIAANMYLTRRIDRIIITRPNVSVGKDLGYLPGSLEEKFTPWAMPILEVLNEQMGKGVVETGIKNGNIEMAPMSTMRGRSFKESFVILDEGQNTTIPEIKMFLTRIGKNCKVVINGDIKQSDIKEQSGLSKIIHLAKKYSIDIPIIEFQIEDIVRSDICRDWIIAFESEGI
jgi:phosphate starvation-inducible protein PhoH and related proteins